MRKSLFGLVAALTAGIGAKCALAQSPTTGNTLGHTLGEDLARTGIWMVIAVVLFAVAYKLADLATPGDLKQQLAEGNTAMAIFAGSLIIGFALIIAALVG